MDCPLPPHNCPEIHFADGKTESQLAGGYRAARQLGWSQRLNSFLPLRYAVSSEDSYLQVPSSFYSPCHWTAAPLGAFLSTNTPKQPAGPGPDIRTCKIPSEEGCCSPGPISRNTGFLAHYSVLIERLTFFFKGISCFIFPALSREARRLSANNLSSESCPAQTFLSPWAHSPLVLSQLRTDIQQLH